MRQLVLVMLVACGGVTQQVQQDGGDAGVEASTGCPGSDKLSTAVGTSCTQEGLSCGGESCTDPCSFCNIVRCTSGVWTQMEAFPDPNCSDAPVCSYPPANNDPLCPATYSVQNYKQTCSPVGLACAYPGMGDGLSNGCYATAMMWCVGDGGEGTWTVAQ